MNDAEQQVLNTIMTFISSSSPCLITSSQVAQFYPAALYITLVNWPLTYIMICLFLLVYCAFCTMNTSSMRVEFFYFVQCHWKLVLINKWMNSIRTSLNLLILLITDMNFRDKQLYPSKLTNHEKHYRMFIA